MVGREDEVHFMLPSGWWTSAGLVLSLVGVVLLFRYGMPYRVRTRGQPIRVAISSDPRAATLGSRNSLWRAIQRENCPLPPWATARSSAM